MGIKNECVINAGVFKFRKDRRQVPHSLQGIFQIFA
jgi:hypothetical protein